MEAVIFTSLTILIKLPLFLLTLTHFTEFINLTEFIKLTEVINLTKVIQTIIFLIDLVDFKFKLLVELVLVFIVS